MIAVCLLTCGRESYTARTLDSFSQFNGGDRRFMLLHADDASATDENVALACAHGFRTVVQSSVRRGWRITRTALFEQAARVAEWVLFLENDIETLRPFPWALFAAVKTTPNVYCLRLYGRFKDAHKTDECLSTHKRLGHRPVDWRPWRNAPEASQIGVIHWSAQPAVTKIGPLLNLHRHGTEPYGYTVRVKKNVMAHFGNERTIENRKLAREGACA